MSTQDDYSKEKEAVSSQENEAPREDTVQASGLKDKFSASENIGPEVVDDDTNVSEELPDENAGEDNDLKQRIRELEEENSDLKDKYLRKHADFENFRKRMLREKEDFAKYANQQLLSDLVSVIDDFERAIYSTRESQDFHAFHDGIVMIEKQLVNILESKYGLHRFDSVGEEFDPQRHEAVASAPAAEGQDVSRVEEVFQKGYMLHDRILRSAKVKVSLPGS